MAISKEELAGKQARVAHLRSEIRAFRTADVETRLEAERDVVAADLDEEIRKLEAQLPVEAKSAGGTVEDAVAAMERAAQVEEMVAGPKETGSNDETPKDAVAGLVAKADAQDGGNR